MMFSHDCILHFILTQFRVRIYGSIITSPELNEQLDKILARLDTIIILLFDLAPNKDIGKSVSMTTKVGYLDSLGYDLSEITKMVRRPSNYTSSRLREYKERNEKKKKRGSTLKIGKDTTEEQSQSDSDGGENE